MLSVFLAIVKCARARPFWRETEAAGVVSNDINSEKKKLFILERSHVISSAISRQLEPNCFTLQRTK